MRIIQRRTPFSNWSEKVICNGKDWEQDGKIPCGSILEMSVEDLVFREHQRYGKTSVTKDYGYVCPVCKCFSLLNTLKLDKNLKSLAKEYTGY